ncbi:MAG: ADYC domain-containing protein [Nannocystaceae bacterium]
MIRLTTRTIGFVALLGSLSACDAPPPSALDPDPWLGEIEFRGTRPWPPPGGTLNTAWLGDSPLMRLIIGPVPIERTTDSDVVVQSVDLLVDGHYESVPTSNVELDGSELVVSIADVEYRGEGLEGSRWRLSGPGGGFIEIVGVDSHDGLYNYLLDYHSPRMQPAQPTEVCAAPSGGSQWTYMVGDVAVDAQATITDEPGTLLVACVSGALGKAIDWGFTPWADQRPLYQAGIRTILADYCGNGTSHTADGIPIQVANAAAGKMFTDADAPTEAVFGPDGALCLSEFRFSSVRLAHSSASCSIPSCGSDMDVEALMSGASTRAWTKLDED